MGTFAGAFHGSRSGCSVALPQRLAIELFRRQKSRGSSPPDSHPGPSASERGQRSGKSSLAEDGSPTSTVEAKEEEEEEEEEEERTQHDDSNVSYLFLGCVLLASVHNEVGLCL